MKKKPVQKVDEKVCLDNLFQSSDVPHLQNLSYFFTTKKIKENVIYIIKNIDSLSKSSLTSKVKFLELIKTSARQELKPTFFLVTSVIRSNNINPKKNKKK